LRVSIAAAVPTRHGCALARKFIRAAGSAASHPDILPAKSA
jgi:hypothetical protein